MSLTGIENRELRRNNWELSLNSRLDSRENKESSVNLLLNGTVQTFQPLNIKKNLDILLKVGRFYFFPIKIKQTLFHLGMGVMLLFKHYLALFVIPVVTRCCFFKDQEVVITRKKLIAKGSFLPNKQTNRGQNVRQSANKALKRHYRSLLNFHFIQHGNISF